MHQMMVQDNYFHVYSWKFCPTLIDCPVHATVDVVGCSCLETAGWEHEVGSPTAAYVKDSLSVSHLTAHYWYQTDVQVDSEWGCHTWNNKAEKNKKQNKRNVEADRSYIQSLQNSKMNKDTKKGRKKASVNPREQHLFDPSSSSPLWVVFAQ